MSITINATIYIAILVTLTIIIAVLANYCYYEGVFKDSAFRVGGIFADLTFAARTQQIE